MEFNEVCLGSVEAILAAFVLPLIIDTLIVRVLFCRCSIQGSVKSLNLCVVNLNLLEEVCTLSSSLVVLFLHAVNLASESRNFSIDCWNLDVVDSFLDVFSSVLCSSLVCNTRAISLPSLCIFIKIFNIFENT